MRSQTLYYVPPQGAAGAAGGAATQAASYYAPPPNPEALLIERQRRSWFSISPLMLLLLAALLLEIFAPTAMKPSKFAGQGAANFYGEIMQADNDKNLDYVGLEDPVRTHALRETEAVAWRGRCAMGFVLDVELGALCTQLVGAFYSQTLPPARTYRQRYHKAQW